jgi:NADH-quinone oxidoreductase subunit G
LDGAVALTDNQTADFARISPETAAELGLSEGQAVTVAAQSGAITLPLRLTAMPPRVVWLPVNSVASRVLPTLGVAGGIVQVSAAKEVPA